MTLAVAGPTIGTRNSLFGFPKNGHIMANKWIQKAIKAPGALRKSLGAKPGKPIPVSKLASAAAKPGKLGQRARLAQTLRKLDK
jgi:hypothetical protein